MAFLFGRSRPRPLPELVKTTKDLLFRYSQDATVQPRIQDDLARNLAQMKQIFQGTAGMSFTEEAAYVAALQGLPQADLEADQEAPTEQELNPTQVSELLMSLYVEGMFQPLAENLHRLPFESRKDCQVIFCTAFRFQDPSRNANEPFVLAELLIRNQEVFETLCKGYDRRESAQPCGHALREALKRDAATALILYKEPDEYLDFASIDTTKRASGRGVFWSFFDWIDKGPFEVSSDAFNTFRDILTRHSHIVAPFLQTNFDHFFSLYNTVLVQSDSYVTKRQSTKLLGEILLNRANFSIMTQYVESGEHLKIIMKLLKDDRKMINYEAFHVFKVFVANPNKSIAVQKILISNREKLLRFLPNFLADRTDDDQFVDEKSFLIRSIELLPPVPVEPGTAAPPKAA